MTTNPLHKPTRPNFSSGPCAKPLGWSPDFLNKALLGRSHRSQEGIELLQRALQETRDFLSIPDDYHIAIVPGSTTGAFEMGLWNLLGERPTDMLVFDVFGGRWASDLHSELKLADLTIYNAEPGCLPDLTHVDWDHDVAFTWNASTSGIRFPNGNWIPESRNGLSLCDATSAVFGMPLPWDKLDFTAFSWQKAIGGEAGHGMIVLSPRAVQRLESYKPSWPIPYVFRMTNAGKFHQDLFKGMTLNTPSLMVVEDYLECLKWGRVLGGAEVLFQRSRENLKVLQDWVAQQDWIAFLCQDAHYLSSTTICLRLTDPEITGLTPQDHWAFLKQMAALLAQEGVAYDILNHTGTVPSLRVWGGPTIESQDLKQLLPWLTWSYHQIRASEKQAA